MTFVYDCASDECPLHLVNQKKKGKTEKMTPNDIATNISGLKPVGDSNLTSMTTGTQSFVGRNWTIDDASTFG